MYHNLFSLTDISFKDKIALVRVGYDVPLYGTGAMSDVTRIEESFPTIRHIMNEGGTVVLMTHLGRPGGKRKEGFELDPIADYLREMLDVEVIYLKEIVESEVKVAISKAKELGALVLLENLRFYPGEKENNVEFSKMLASLGDVYVNEAFSVSHRAHASIVGVPKLMKEKVMGSYFESEVQAIDGVLESHEHPVTLILGGAKTDTKAGIIKSFLGKADNFLVGGALANTFLAAQGYEVGKSKYEEAMIPLAQDSMALVEKEHDHFYLPTDVIACDEATEQSCCVDVHTNAVTKDMKILDIGDETIAAYKEIIAKSKTIIWNGPLGLFEIDRFSKSTEEIAKAIAVNKNALTLIGGGDTVEALNKLGVSFKEFSHVSTAGGALIEYIEKKTLPGIEALQ